MSNFAELSLVESQEVNGGGVIAAGLIITGGLAVVGGGSFAAGYALASWLG